jgi:sulfur-oxidizing protein SoxY
MRILIALAFLVFAAVPGWAAEDEADRAQRWKDLQHAVFGDRPVADGTGVVTLEAPPRALDAALVPITVTVADTAHIKALYLTVDSNPSPLVGTFRFGPAADPHVIRTRVRVEQYTLMHAVVETDDGRLLAAERFVKAAGGCSAPMGADSNLALSRLGQMRFRVEGDLSRPTATDTGRLLISHPNNNGMQVDQFSHNFIPARYIQSIKVSTGDTVVFTLDSDISLSEDPSLTFDFRPAGPLNVEMEDSSRAVFKHSFDLPQ